MRAATQVQYINMAKTIYNINKAGSQHRTKSPHYYLVYIAPSVQRQLKTRALLQYIKRHKPGKKMRLEPVLKSFDRFCILDIVW